MNEIGLVGCSALKLRHPAPARELYRSPLFRKASAYVQTRCERWYVLSARHGLVKPDTVLDPYDVTFTGDSISVWADRVRQQLLAELVGVPDPLLVVLAGERYRSFLAAPFLPSVIPMQGLGIGEQLSWLTGQLRAA